MPLIVDRDAVKLSILNAYEKCIGEKPITNVTMRDIASKAHMSHPKLFYYFKDKNEIILAYAEHIKNYFSEKCVNWFKQNDMHKFNSNREYINRFMEYVVEAKNYENKSNATMQLYILGHYDKNIAKIIKSAFESWKITTQNCLMGIYGDQISSKEAEAVMIIVAGIFLCNYNNATSNEVNANTLNYIDKFRVIDNSLLLK